MKDYQGAQEFLKKLEELYLELGKYLQKKYAIGKKTSATSSNPCAREHTWTYDQLQELHKYFELFIHEGKNGDQGIEL